MKFNIRRSIAEDLDFLISLEKQAFPIFQQSSRKSILNSLNSIFQEVWISETNDVEKNKTGVLVLFKYKKTIRIFSIAVLPDFQKMGVGKLLLHQAFQIANNQGYQKITLEVNSDDEKLVQWYTQNGFIPLTVIQNYYMDGKNAIKMVYHLNDSNKDGKLRNLIVMNHPFKWTFDDINASVIPVKEFISNASMYSGTDLRIFNLCSSYEYQSFGYYVSLLASARGQRVVPSITTLRDFRILPVIRSIASDIEEVIKHSLNKMQGSKFSINVYFGQTTLPGFNKLAKNLYQIFQAPLFKVDFTLNDNWAIRDIKVLNFERLPAEELPYIQEFARNYFNKKRFNKTRLKTFKYDVAILVNAEEKTPPSCSIALSKFKAAGNKLGMYVEFISKSDIDKINEFDALFIRETTSVNDHTYELSRIAYAEGLVVIDDPWSIVRCSNKIYQNEIFSKNKILVPKATVITKNSFSNKPLQELNYPLVIKQPDSAFSIGIKKVENPEEAFTVLTELFKKTDMVICQEFLYSDFDWRIGILDNAPLFACKYYMSKGHWQIYNWKDGSDEENAGDWQTFSVSDVPEEIVKTALQATALIGDGLYGVDLKMIDGKVYVIEVNDNPNIDYGIEDLFLKDKIYARIMESLFKRIEISRNIQRLITE
jgi:glutathione synthase/RimK-type ligase-like ATP-grasp enzyme/ribosomal protein S18 acetylase RimI-like enzyme